MKPPPGCTVCGGPGAMLDLVHGRRCAEHPPTFSPRWAVETAVRTGHADGLRYCRGTWPA